MRARARRLAHTAGKLPLDPSGGAQRRRRPPRERLKPAAVSTRARLGGVDEKAGRARTARRACASVSRMDLASQSFTFVVAAAGGICRTSRGWLFGDQARIAPPPPPRRRAPAGGDGRRLLGVAKARTVERRRRSGRLAAGVVGLAACRGGAPGGREMRLPLPRAPTGGSPRATHAAAGARRPARVARRRRRRVAAAVAARPRQRRCRRRRRRCRRRQLPPPFRSRRRLGGGALGGDGLAVEQLEARRVGERPRAEARRVGRGCCGREHAQAAQAAEHGHRARELVVPAAGGGATAVAPRGLLCDASSACRPAQCSSSSHFAAIWLRLRLSTCSSGTPPSGGTSASRLPCRSSVSSRGSCSATPSPLPSALRPATSVLSATKRLRSVIDRSSLSVRLISASAAGFSCVSSENDLSLNRSWEKSSATG